MVIRDCDPRVRAKALFVCKCHPALQQLCLTFRIVILDAGIHVNGKAISAYIYTRVFCYF